MGPDFDPEKENLYTTFASLKKTIEASTNLDPEYILKRLNQLGHAYDEVGYVECDNCPVAIQLLNEILFSFRDEEKGQKFLWKFEQFAQEIRRESGFIDFIDDELKQLLTEKDPDGLVDVREIETMATSVSLGSLFHPAAEHQQYFQECAHGVIFSAATVMGKFDPDNPLEGFVALQAKVQVQLAFDLSDPASCCRDALLEYDQLVERYPDLLSKFPGDEYEVKFNLGAVFFRAGHKEQAFEVFQHKSLLRGEDFLLKLLSLSVDCQNLDVFEKILDTFANDANALNRALENYYKLSLGRIKDMKTKPFGAFLRSLNVRMYRLAETKKSNDLEFNTNALEFYRSAAMLSFKAGDNDLAPLMLEQAFGYLGRVKELQSKYQYLEHPAMVLLAKRLGMSKYVQNPKKFALPKKQRGELREDEIARYETGLKMLEIQGMPKDHVYREVLGIFDKQEAHLWRAKIMSALRNLQLVPNEVGKQIVGIAELGSSELPEFECEVIAANLYRFQYPFKFDGHECVNRFFSDRAVRSLIAENYFKLMQHAADTQNLDFFRRVATNAQEISIGPDNLVPMQILYARALADKKVSGF